MTNDLHHEIKSKKYNFGSWLYRQKILGQQKLKLNKNWVKEIFWVIN